MKTTYAITREAELEEILQLMEYYFNVTIQRPLTLEQAHAIAWALTNTDRLAQILKSIQPLLKSIQP